MQRERVRAVRMFPGDHRFVPTRTALGSLLDALSRRRIPLLLSLERSGMDYAQVDRLLSDFPRLSCVLCDVGIWGADRFIRLLLERFPRVRVETSCLVLHDSVLESLVRRYGAARFLFGTDIPWFDFHYSIAGVVAADIAEDDMRNIFYRNARKLFGFQREDGEEKA